MMSTNKRTEDFIKEKLDGREFAFDEGAWAEAEMLIEAQGAGNARRILLWVFSANVLIGLVALFAWLMPMGNNQSDTNTIASNGNTTTESAIALNEQKPSVEVNMANTTIENTAKPTAETKLDKPANITSKQANTKQVNAEAAKTTTGKTADKKTSKGVNQVNTGISNNSAKPSGTDKTNKNERTTTNNVANPAANTTDGLDNKDAVNPQVENQTNGAANSAELPDAATAGQNVENSELAQADDKAKEEAQVVPEAAKVNPIVTATEESKKASDKGVVSVETKVKADKRLAQVNTNDEPKEPYKPSGETGNSSKKNKFTWPPQIPKPQPPAKGGRNSWGIIAGISVWDPYASTLGARSWNGVVGATAGLSYERALTKRIWFGANAIYWSRGALNFNHVINEGQGAIGDSLYVNNKTILTPSVSHIINIPLYVKFDISRHHHALIGVSGTYLMATTYESRKLKETASGTQDLGTRKITGQHPGFYKYDVMMMFGYEYSITDRLMAGTRFNYGFYDRTKNTYQNITSYDKNINLEFTLKYDFLRH